MAINNSSILMASKFEGIWMYINPEIYSLFDIEGLAYLESYLDEGEIFLYKCQGLDANYCLNRNELSNQNN